MIQYYSNITKELYETEEACLKAEQAHTAAACKKKEEERRKSEERKARAQEVEDARKILDEARKKYRIAANEAATNYRKLLEDFCKDYGSYHYTIKSSPDNKNLVEDELNRVINTGLFDLAHSFGIL